MTLNLLDPEDGVFMNLLKDPPASSKESQSDGPQLCYGSKNCTEISFSVRRKGETEDQTRNLFPDQDNMVEAEAVRKAFVDLGLAPKTNRELVEELVDILESSLTLESEYHENLVELSGTEDMGFAESPGKSRVVIVAGESGSGKTTFSQYGIKRLAAEESVRNSTAVIYYSLTKEVGNMFKIVEEDLSDEDALIRMLISQSLRRFSDSQGEKNSAEEAAYNLVGSLSSVLNKKRNIVARDLFDESIQRFFSEKPEKPRREGLEWWEGRRSNLVLDGTGHRIGRGRPGPRTSPRSR